MATSKENGYALTSTKHHSCGHSKSRLWRDTPLGTEDKHKEAMLAAKCNKDDPSKEIIWILKNKEQLDKDMFNCLICYLKVPAPSLQNPPLPKEVLFSAHLISLVSKKMWRYGLVHKSKHFWPT
ncbi:hypothetical protein ACQY0O_005948 [Thecaphora frezii]